MGCIAEITENNTKRYGAKVQPYNIRVSEEISRRAVMYEFDNLMKRMVNGSPHTYKNLIA